MFAKFISLIRRFEIFVDLVKAGEKNFQDLKLETQGGNLFLS